ncbi:MAG TPA: uracil-DNA glycosylase [Acetobacteraceae bacterium]|nr:uracil-DNA glycosylase [Acetobacteraceae bacterium]
MDALAALALHIAWGADEALDDTPVDRTKPAAPAPRILAAVPAPAAPPPQAAKPGPIARAASIAAAANTLEELRAALAGFTDCPLAATATNLVFADGNPAAGLVFVGEAPGAEEDLSGKPFVGASGKFLDRMLASIGIDRTKCLITNLIFWRPPGNRAPTDAEVLMCLPFVHRHLALLQPRIVVTLGALATHALLSTDIGIRKLRGKWRTLPNVDPSPRVLPMLHPAYLLRTPGAKKDAWQDLIALRRALDAKDET